MSETHFVEVPCNCEDIENCLLELYVSDVRILMAELTERNDVHESTQTGL